MKTSHSQANLRSNNQFSISIFQKKMLENVASPAVLRKLKFKGFEYKVPAFSTASPAQLSRKQYSKRNTLENCQRTYIQTYITMFLYIVRLQQKTISNLSRHAPGNCPYL